MRSGKRGGVSAEAAVDAQVPEDSHGRNPQGVPRVLLGVRRWKIWVQWQLWLWPVLVTMGIQGGMFCCFAKSWSRNPWDRGLGKDPGVIPRQQIPFAVPW